MRTALWPLALLALAVAAYADPTALEQLAAEAPAGGAAMAAAPPAAASAQGKSPAPQDEGITFSNSDAQITIAGHMFRVGWKWTDGNTIVGLRSLESWTDRNWEKSKVVITSEQDKLANEIFRYNLYVVQPDASIKKHAILAGVRTDATSQYILGISWYHPSPENAQDHFNVPMAYEEFATHEKHKDFDLGSMNFHEQYNGFARIIVSIPNPKFIEQMLYDVSGEDYVISLLDGEGNWHDSPHRLP